MADTRAAWGIDIGQSALKAIKLRYLEGAGQVVAEAFDYIPFPKILSQPDAIPDEIVPEAMQTFLSRNSLSGDAVAISVPGQSALARFIQLPPVESSKLHEIVKYEARQQIPFALEDVIWDYQPLGAGAEESGFLLDAEVGLFAMKKEQIHQQLRPYNEAKVEVELIQIAPLALYSVLSFDELDITRETDGEPGEEYYIMLDMGCDNTTLMVSNGYKIWIRNVPIGGNHFTRALTKEMKLSFAKAEHLKCNATKSPDPRAVFQALRPVFNDYVSEIQRSIGYFSSVNRAAKIVKVVGLGNGFKLAGLQKFLQQNLQYEVERPDTYQRLAGDAVLNSPMFSENVLSFAVPYGLALQGLDITRIRTSLLPPEIRLARQIRRKKPWAVATAAGLLLGLSLSTVGNAFSYKKVTTPQFAEAETKAGEFSKEVSDFASAYGAEKSEYESIQAKLDELTLGRRSVAWMDVFNAVIDCLPRDEGENPPEAIEKKNAISLTQFSAERVSDMSSWYGKLTEQQKTMLTEAERESGPTGEGYIFTLRGEHFHNEPEKRGQSRILYVINNFLKNLQQPRIQQLDYPPRDVGRLGISHATIVEWSASTVLMTPAGQRKPKIAVPRFGNRRGGPMNQFGPMGDPSLGGPMEGGYPGETPYGSGQPGTNPNEMKEYEKTDFVIQFAFKYVPPEERPPLEEPAAAANEPAPESEVVEEVPLAPVPATPEGAAPPQGTPPQGTPNNGAAPAAPGNPAAPGATAPPNTNGAAPSPAAP